MTSESFAKFPVTGDQLTRPLVDWCHSPTFQTPHQCCAFPFQFNLSKMVPVLIVNSTCVCCISQDFDATPVSSLFVRDLTADVTTSRFLKAQGAHQAKAGSLSIPSQFANSDTSAECDSFMSLSGIHVLSPPFHLANFQPSVVFLSLCWPLLVTANRSEFGVAFDSSF